MSYKELFGISQVYKIIWIFSQSLFFVPLKTSTDSQGPLCSVQYVFPSATVLETTKAKKHLHLEPGPFLHIVTEGRRGVILLAPPHHSFWLKLMAPSTHSDTDVLLGAGYCLAQRNQCSPIHKSNPRLVEHRFVMLLHNRVSGLDGDTMRENDHS